MHNREKQLMKNTLIVAVGRISTQFISFFLLPLYTALLSTEEYGTVDLFNTYIALLIPLFFFQSDQAVFRFLIDVRDQKDESDNLISNCIISTLFQCIFWVLCYSLLSPIIKNDYKFFLVTNLIAAEFSNLLLQITRGLGDNITYSIGSLLSGAGSVVLNVLFIAFMKMGAEGMLLATFIGNVICILFVLIKKQLFCRIKIKYFNWQTVKSLWKYSIPLIPNQLSWWGVNTSDRVIINMVLGSCANGIYSASNKFSSICITVFNIFNMTWSESTSMHIKDGDADDFFSKVFNNALRIFIALVYGIIAFMPFVFRFLITGAGYADAYYQIPILMISTIFTIMVSLLGSIYVALKKSTEIAKTSIIAAVINLLINIIFINKIGLYAASISTVVAYLSMTIYRFIDIQKYVKIKLKMDFLFASILTGGILMIIYYLQNQYLCIIGAIISVIFAFLYNKNLIKILTDIIINCIFRSK